MQRGNRGHIKALQALLMAGVAFMLSAGATTQIDAPKAAAAPKQTKTVLWVATVFITSTTACPATSGN